MFHEISNDLLELISSVDNIKLLELQSGLKSKQATLDHLKCSSKASTNFSGSSPRKNLFYMHENTSKLAHTSVVGEAPVNCNLRTCLEKSVCYQLLQLFIKNLKVNVKCYTFTCKVLISSGVDTTSCKLPFNCTRKITNSVLIFFLLNCESNLLIA